MEKAENKLVIEINGDSKGFEKELQSVTKQLQLASNNANQAGKNSGSAFGTGFGKGAESGLRLVTEGFKPIEQAAGVSFTGIASSFKNLLLNPITGGIALIGSSLFAAFKAAQFGEELAKTERNFNRLALSAGIVGSELRSGLEQAASGLTGTDDLIKIANKSIITLGSSAQRLPELFVLAQKAAAGFGGDAASRLEEITQAISRLQTRQLKQIGLNIDADATFKAYALSIGTTADKLSDTEKKQALLNAVIEQGGEQLKNIDAEVNKPSISNGLKRITVGLDDLKEAFSAFADSAFGSAIGAFFNNFGNGLQVIAEKFNKFAGVQGTVQDQLNATRGRLLELSIALRDTEASEIAVKRTQAEIDVLRKKELALEDQINKEKKLVEEKAKLEQQPKIREQTESEINAERDRLQRISDLKAEFNAIELQTEIDQKARIAEINNVTAPDAFALNEAKFQQQIESNNKELELQIQKNLKIKDEEERAQANALAVGKKISLDKKAIGEKELQDVKTIEQQKLAVRQANLQALSNIIQAGSALAKEGSAAQKTLNIASAIQSTYVAATAALQPPPNGLGPLAGIPLAASTVALGLANVAKISGANKGALVTKGVKGKDTEPFMLSRGEIVAPAKSFDEVVEGTARQRGFVKQENNKNQNETIQPQINITINGDLLADDTYINRLVDQIRDAVQFRGADLGV